MSETSQSAGEPGKADDQLTVGQLVEVADPGLAALRDLMRSITGSAAPPNHIGVVVEFDHGAVLVEFPDGQVAPYERTVVRPVERRTTHAQEG